MSLNQNTWENYIPNWNEFFGTLINIIQDKTFTEYFAYGFIGLLIYFFWDIFSKIDDFERVQKNSSSFELKHEKKEKHQEQQENFRDRQHQISDQQSTVNFKTASEALEFINKITEEKFNFYLFGELLPLYQKSKIPETSVITEIKNSIYLSITASLTSDMKLEILKFFTKKGIEMHIHEKIMLLMNKIDYTLTSGSKNFNEINPNNIHKIL